MHTLIRQLPAVVHMNMLSLGGMRDVSERAFDLLGIPEVSVRSQAKLAKEQILCQRGSLV